MGIVDGREELSVEQCVLMMMGSLVTLVHSYCWQAVTSYIGQQVGTSLLTVI